MCEIYSDSPHVSLFAWFCYCFAASSAANESGDLGNLARAALTDAGDAKASPAEVQSTESKPEKRKHRHRSKDKHKKSSRKASSKRDKGVIEVQAKVSSPAESA